MAQTLPQQESSIPLGVLNGDCLEVLKSLPSHSYGSCITDPPYNYEFVGHKWNHEEIQRRLDNVSNSKTLVKNLPYGSGLAGGVRNERWYNRIRENILEYQEWTANWGGEVFRVLKPGAYIAVFNSTRTSAHVQVALENAGFYARDQLVWRRNSGIPKGLNLEDKLNKLGHSNPEIGRGLHSALRAEWESIVLLQKPLKNNYFTTFLEFGTGLMRTEHQDVPGFQSNILEGYKATKADTSVPHPTVKPLSLMEKLVEMLSPEGESVLDPFAGSGSTLVAARNLGRQYLGIELVQQHFELINERLETASDSAGEKLF
jgi:site-specific DNA-methyltransferase (adenine-specific)